MSNSDNGCEGEEGKIEYLTEWPVTQDDTKCDEVDVEPVSKRSKIVHQNGDDSSDDDDGIDTGVTARMAIAVWHRRRQRSGKGLRAR